MRVVPDNEIVDLARAIMVRLDTGEPLYVVLPSVHSLTQATDDGVLQLWVRHEIYGLQKPSQEQKETEEWQTASQIFTFLRSARNAPSEALSNSEMMSWFQEPKFEASTIFTASMADLEQVEDVDSSGNIWLTIQQQARRSVVARVRSYCYEVASNAYILAKSRLKLVEFEDELAAVSEPAARDESLDEGVFVVHGKDETLKDRVSHLLSDLGIQPVILHQLPNSGQTIIEKLEAASIGVSFAIVLLTPDDVGRLASESSESEASRARQNVIFELGYYIGKLGRSRVCALYKPDIDLPTDYDGVVYVPVDEGLEWRVLLLRELESAGFEIDWSILGKSV